MLEIGDLLIAGLAMAATVLLLGIGCAVGNYFGRQCVPRVLNAGQQAANRPSPADRCELTETSHKLKAEAAALSQILADHSRTVPPELACAIERLAFTCSQIGKEIQAFNDPESANRCTIPLTDQTADSSPLAPKAGCLPPTESKVSPIATGTLTPEEMRSFRIAAGAPPTEGDDSTKRRYPYECWQTVVPKVDGIISPARAAKVRCHEVSAHGLSFFWPEPPDFERAMISLGPERNPIFMRAHILQSKTVFMHDQVQVLVECRFTGRYESSSSAPKHIGTSGGEVASASPVLATPA